jgi:hypothetical protein
MIYIPNQDQPKSKVRSASQHCKVCRKTIDPPSASSELVELPEPQQRKGRIRTLRTTTLKVPVTIRHVLHPFVRMQGSDLVDLSTSITDHYGRNSHLSPDDAPSILSTSSMSSSTSFSVMPGAWRSAPAPLSSTVCLRVNQAWLAKCKKRCKARQPQVNGKLQTRRVWNHQRFQIGCTLARTI